MSWRVPAHPQEAASTPVRRTSTLLPMLTPPKLSLETHRSWRSSLRIWIKCWRRCELWFWWQLWSGAPTDEPRASPTQPLLLCPCQPPPAWVMALLCQGLIQQRCGRWAVVLLGHAVPLPAGEDSASMRWAELLLGTLPFEAGGSPGDCVELESVPLWKPLGVFQGR